MSKAAIKSGWKILFKEALIPWKACHAMGPLKEFSFSQQIKPVIRAACKSHAKASGSCKRRSSRFKHYMSKNATDIPAMLSERIAQDCWTDLEHISAHR